MNSVAIIIKSDKNIDNLKRTLSSLSVQLGETYKVYILSEDNLDNIKKIFDMINIEVVKEIQIKDISEKFLMFVNSGDALISVSVLNILMENLEEGKIISTRVWSEKHIEGNFLPKEVSETINSYEGKLFRRDITNIEDIIIVNENDFYNIDYLFGINKLRFISNLSTYLKYGDL